MTSLSYVAIATIAITYANYATENIFDPCDVAIRNSTLAPDGRTAVVVFEMECGATAPFNTQASLVPAGKAFLPRKNPPFLVLDGKHSLSVTWTAPSAVRIGIPDAVTVFKKEQSVEGVTVAYQ